MIEAFFTYKPDPCPTCGGRIPIDHPECSTCYFEGLIASGLYRFPGVDLSSFDLATLDRMHLELLCGKWPAGFPLPEPDGYRKRPIRDPATGDVELSDRPDEAWFLWDRSLWAIIEAKSAMEDRGKTWRDRPPML